MQSDCRGSSFGGTETERCRNWKHSERCYRQATKWLSAAKPLCYSQIGGLIIATFTTLLLVPVLYSIFVLDLKLIKWGASE